MDNILITSREFGRQLGDAHRQALEHELVSRGCRIIVHPVGKPMKAGDILRVNRKHPLHAILVYSSLDQVNATVIRGCTHLKVISRHGVGVDNIDVETATRAGIPVCTTAAARAHESVADFTFALLLTLVRRVAATDRAMRAGARFRPISPDVWGKTLGIVGLGRIGKAVARRASGFSMSVLTYSPRLLPETAATYGAQRVPLKTLLQQSDIVTLHASLNPGSRGMIGRQELALMKPGAFLINTARAGLVDRPALLAALTSGSLGGAAVDVFDYEPAFNDPLITAGLEHLVATSHIASYTTDSLRRMDLTAVRNILDALA